LTRPRLWSDDIGVRRPLAVLLAALMCAALTVLAVPLHAVAAQEPDAPADDGTGGSADEEPEENPQPGAVEQDIIPRPNSGHEPTEAGDRGGALQVLVLVAIVAGLGTIALLATRDVRRSRDRARRAEPAEPAP
jgi:hypothetical protein